MTNHLSDLADRLEAVALEIDEIDKGLPLKDGDRPRASHLRAAAVIVRQLPCEHNPVTEYDDTEEPESDALLRTVCQYCRAELVQTWVAKLHTDGLPIRPVITR